MHYLNIMFFKQIAENYTRIKVHKKIFTQITTLLYSFKQKIKREEEPKNILMQAHLEDFINNKTLSTRTYPNLCQSTSFLFVSHR